VAYRHLGVLQACSKRLAGELYPLVAVEDLRGSKRERRLQGLQKATSWVFESRHAST
jgi:hypothetical protein